MGNNISKASDAAISRVTFRLTKSGIRFSYKDHLALELLQEQSSMAIHTLSAALSNDELQQLPTRIENMISVQPQTESLTPDEFMHQYRASLILQASESKRLSTIHILRDIVADTTTATSQILAQYGITAQSIDQLIEELTDIEIGAQSKITHHKIARPDTSTDKRVTTMLERFGSDLTRMAREGGIDGVIGRDNEIERIIQILSRRKKNNPLLIGEAGVGKSAIIEGLAIRIADGNVPHTLRNKRLFSLDMASLVAGTKFRGEFEERLQQLLDELQSNGDTIIFIDEIHTIAGAGATQGSLDTANILKPALARGQIQTIGATTMDECRRYIESDAALERRFQKIIIEPTSPEATLDILHQIAPHYEHHHNVIYSDEALKACVTLAQRYITDRHFPDKAIDLLDEAGAQCSRHDFDKPHKIVDIEQRLQAAEEEHRQAIDEQAYEQATMARLKILALQAHLDEQIASWQRHIRQSPAVVDREEIERVVTTITGIPTERLSQGEAQRLIGLNDHLQQVVIGQAEAVKRISSSLLRSRAGLRDHNKPIGVFLFTGPTGVGKTLLAKELASWLNDNSRSLIRIDMSEYTEKHNTSRLIGSPPGYIGYGEGGQLTEAVRRQPYAVILFDEVEKAHPDVTNILLQLFDEGHLTDGSGRRVDFRNTIIILTSNVGSRSIVERGTAIGFSTPSKLMRNDTQPHDEYRKALEQTFSPELLNRIDDIICFHRLNIQDVEQILDLELEKLLSRAEALGYKVAIMPDAKSKIAAMGFDAQYGVRSLKRCIADQIEEPLATIIINGSLRAGAEVIIESVEDRINLRVA